MRYFIFLTFFAQSLFLKAQPIQWFEINPTWNVLFTAGFAGAGPETVTVEGDTILNGRTSTILKRENFIQTHYSYTAQAGDSILLWLDGEFHLMYDFTKDSGFVFTLPKRYGYGTANISFEVQSNSSLQLGSTTLRTQIWKLLDTPQDIFYEMVEGIGVSRIYSPNGYESAHHLFWNEPDNSAVDGEAWYLCRYRSDLGVFDPFPLSYPCTEYVSVEENLEKEVLVSVYPNPATDVLFIQLENTNHKAQFSLKNSLGQVVFSVPSFRGFQQFEFGHLDDGLYFYEIRINEKQVVHNGRLIKY